jgi:hypothetical protein
MIGLNKLNFVGMLNVYVHYCYWEFVSFLILYHINLRVDAFFDKENSSCVING